MKNQKAATDGKRKLAINTFINFKVAETNYCNKYYNGIYDYLKQIRNLHLPTGSLIAQAIIISNTKENENSIVN